MRKKVGGDGFLTIDGLNDTHMRILLIVISDLPSHIVHNFPTHLPPPLPGCWTWASSQPSEAF